MRFSSFFSYGISLSPVIHCLWSIRLHACQLCLLAFMSTDLYNKSIAIVWHKDLIYFCSSHTQRYMESWGIVASTRSESRKLWLLKMTVTFNRRRTLCSHWMLYFWHYSAGPSEIFSVVQGEIVLWVVLRGQWHSQTHLHLTLNAMTLRDVWEAKTMARMTLLLNKRLKRFPSGLLYCMEACFFYWKKRR